MTIHQGSRGRGMAATLVALGLAATALLLFACGDGDEVVEEFMISDPLTADRESGEAANEQEGDVAAESSEAPSEGDGESPRTLRQPSAGDEAAGPASADDVSSAGQDDASHDADAEVPPAEQPSMDGGDAASGGRTSSLHGRIIAIDPGHNGGNFDAPQEINRQVDAGGFTKACNTTGTATQDGYRESTFNLEVAELLRVRLEAAGAAVHLTRTDDEGVGPCIDLRGTFGQQVGADLTISIHADGAGVNARGFHIIHPARWSGSDPAVLDASRQLATVLRDVLVEYGKSPANYVGTDGLVARNDLATLNLSEVPVVLLEAGNMRNVEDAAELRDPRWQAHLADGLVDAIERYLAQQTS